MRAWDDNSSATLTVDFDYDQIDRNLHPHDPDTCSERAIDAASSVLQRAFAWVWQGDCANLDGLVCRAAVVCWIFVPQLRPYTMTEMAGRLGKKKQSLERWVSDFKVRFPEIKNLQHMKHE